MNNKSQMKTTMTIFLVATLILSMAILASGEINNEIQITTHNKEGLELNTITSNQRDVLIDVAPKSVEIGAHSITPHTKVLIQGLNSNEGQLTAKVDDIENSQINTKVFAMDPVEFDKAKIQLPKSGNVDSILTCEDFNLEEFSCKSWIKTDIPFVDHGNFITFTVTHFSAYAGGEIKAINAVHMTENFEEIQNIFSDVESINDVWSQKIQANEVVRVTFEEELTNGRVIDVFVRSQGTIAYFDIYETFSQTLVGRSQTIDQPEHQYMEVNNLPEPSNTFDFKVVKVLTNPEEELQCQNDCLNSCEEDDCQNYCQNDCSIPTTSEDREAYLEFDYIHDNFINSSSADGLVVYGELDIATPRYRTWDETQDFSAEASALSVGSDGVNDILWAVVKGSHERDEMIAGTEDVDGDINIQIFDSADSWGNQIEVIDSVVNSNSRAFDIDVEDVTGDVLIVYDNLSQGVDSAFHYRLWDGTSYSDEVTVTTELSSSNFAWVSLQRKEGTDDIMALLHNAANELYAIPWNGTAFDFVRNTTVTTTTTSIDEEHFSFSWEELSQEGVVLYNEGNNLVLKRYNPTCPANSCWDTSSFDSIGVAQNIDAIRTCSNPSSNHVGIILQDSGNDVNFRMWDGSSILASPPAQDGNTEPNGLNNRNIDCAWFNESTALFGYVDQNQLAMNYLYFTTANSWTGIISTASFAADDINGLAFSKHPSTEEIMIITIDKTQSGRDLTAIRWDGSAFTSPTTATLEGTTEVSDAAQEGGMFDWYRYDTVPNVTQLSPDGDSFAPSVTIDINATIIDNVNLSQVTANITLPNGSIFETIIFDENEDNIFNTTFDITDLVGTYTFNINANDTSNHKNLNDTESITFTVTESSPPSVNVSLPLNTSIFNTSNIIEIAANVTDSVSVGTVWANITLPNSTVDVITLSNDAGDKYNASYTLPNLIGGYNLSFNANDTDGNLNNSESTNFTVNDIITPLVTTFIPTDNSVFNVSNQIEIGATITDNVEIETVLINITLPNATIEQLTLTDVGSNKFNVSYTIPTIIGDFNITYFANDTSGNLNDSELINFSIKDITLPAVVIDAPVESSSFSAYANVSFEFTVSDDVNVSAVLANVTLPNSTIVQEVLLDSDLDGVYDVTFNTTDESGTYTILAIANDTTNNQNETESRTFDILESASPVVTLISPLNNVIQSSDSFVFLCNATDNSALTNITIYHNISGEFLFNETNSTSGTQNQTSYTVSDLNDGSYLWNCEATDDGNNAGFAASNFTVLVDTTPPNVSSLIPIDGTEFSVSTDIDINATVVDATLIDSVLANITLPDDTVVQVNLSDSGSNNIFKGNFSITTQLGTYAVLLIANDSSNNLNDTETINFTVTDTNSISATAIGCTPSTINMTQVVDCNVTATDDILIDTVIANVSLPNGSILTPTVTNTSSDFTFSFSNTTDLVGNYTVLWIANDSSNNIDTSLDSFVVVDIIPPEITLQSPGNHTNSTNENLTFEYNVTENIYPTTSCSIFINRELNQTEDPVNNGTTGTFTVNNLPEGNHNWNVNCTDADNNQNASILNSFTVDHSLPLFVSLLNFPSDEVGLDPATLINITANVTDNFTKVDTVILEYKLSNNSDYTNLTLEYNSSIDQFNGTLNLTVNGTYNLRLLANDTLNNAGISSEVDITVQYDYTWERSPSTFSPFSTELNENVTVGNITINNTGDFPLNFSLGSDSLQMTFNESLNFTLAAGEIRSIEVNDTANTTGVKNYEILITANDTIASPQSQTITGSVVVAANQPILVNSFTTPTGDILEVVRGTSTTFEVSVENIGDGDANNVSLNITLPANWTITSGQANTFFEEILSTDAESNSLTVNIPSTEATSEYAVYVNSSAVNATGTDIAALGLIFGDTVIINVTEDTGALGESSPAEEDEEAEEAPPAPDSNTGGVSDTGGVTKTNVGTGETIFTTEEIKIVRGNQDNIPITLTNLFKNSYMGDIDLSVEGFKSQHVSVEPIIDYSKQVYVDSSSLKIQRLNKPILFNFSEIGTHSVSARNLDQNQIDITLESEPINLTLFTDEETQVDLDNDGTNDLSLILDNSTVSNAYLDIHKLGPPDPNIIRFAEERDYELKIFAPGYLEQDITELEIKITGRLFALNPDKSDFVWRPFTEFRTVSFQVYEVDPVSVKENLELAKQKVQELKDKSIPTSKIQVLLNQAQAAFAAGQIEKAHELTQRLFSLYDDSIEAHNLILELDKDINKAKDKLLDVPEAEKVYRLALEAFKREDFKTAIQRAKDAQLLLILETKGRLNIIWLFKTYWWAIILGAFALAVVGLFSYKKLTVIIISQRLKNLRKEEGAIHSLQKEAQLKYMKDGSLTKEQYDKLIKRYDRRINKIEQLRVKLRNKRANIVKTEKELDALEKEEKDVYKLMKKAQSDYLESGKISRKKFRQIYKSDKVRIAEIKKEKEVLVSRIEKKKFNKASKIIVLFNRFVNKLVKIKVRKKKEKGDYVELKPKHFVNDPKLKAKEEQKKEELTKEIDRTIADEVKSPFYYGLNQTKESKEKRKEVYDALKEMGINVGDKDE